MEGGGGGGGGVNTNQVTQNIIYENISEHLPRHITISINDMQLQNKNAGSGLSNVQGGLRMHLNFI